MKIRGDFVTNSSSSSFILAFYSESNIKETLCEVKDSKDFDIIYQDCMKAEKLNLEQMLDIAYELIEDNVGFNMEYGNEADDLDYDECIDRQWSAIKEAAGDNDVFVYLLYSDDYGTAHLEQSVVPNLNCCIASFSHH